MDEKEILEKFMDMVNQENWSTDVFAGNEPSVSNRLMVATYVIPTPLPYYFLHIDVGYEFNEELGKDIYGEQI